MTLHPAATTTAAGTPRPGALRRTLPVVARRLGACLRRATAKMVAGATVSRQAEASDSTTSGGQPEHLPPTGFADTDIGWKTVGAASATTGPLASRPFR